MLWGREEPGSLARAAAQGAEEAPAPLPAAACSRARSAAMEANAPKRKEPRKALRIKVISMGNAEVGKVRRRDWLPDNEGRARWPIGGRAAPLRRPRVGRCAGSGEPIRAARCVRKVGEVLRD